MLMNAAVITVKILQYIEKTVIKKEFLTVIRVKNCYDDCEDNAIYRENCDKELLSV